MLLDISHKYLSHHDQQSETAHSWVSSTKFSQDSSTKLLWELKVFIDTAIIDPSSFYDQLTTQLGMLD